MKNRIICTLATLIFATSLFSQDVKLKNRLDSVSYAIGVSMYSGSMEFRLKMDYDIVAGSLLEAADSSAKMSMKEAADYIRRVHRQVSDAKAKEAIARGEKFLIENMKVEGIKVTQTGLQYRIIKQGNGPIPTKNDKVKVNYTGYLLDGTKFDSSIDRGQPAVFGVTSVIPGWTEVLLLMQLGSEYVIYLPPHLAYGDRGSGKDIPPASTLIFEIELLDIMKK